MQGAELELGGNLEGEMVNSNWAQVLSRFLEPSESCPLEMIVWQYDFWVEGVGGMNTNGLELQTHTSLSMAAQLIHSTSSHPPFNNPASMAALPEKVVSQS
jgi:hypothetical protein